MRTCSLLYIHMWCILPLVNRTRTDDTDFVWKMALYYTAFNDGHPFILSNNLFPQSTVP